MTTPHRVINFDWFADAKETVTEGVEGLLEAAEESFNFYKGLVTSDEFTGFWRGFGKRSLEIAGVSLFGMGVRTPWTTQMYVREGQQTWEGMKAGAELFTTAWDASWGDESAELRRQEMVGAIVNNFATMSPEEWGSMAPDVLLGVGTGGAGAGRAVLGSLGRPVSTNMIKSARLFRRASRGSENSYGVRFFGQEQVKFYSRKGARIGRADQQVFFSPLEDVSTVRNASDVARATGNAPSVTRAYIEGEEVYGLSFPTNGLQVRTPTAMDAGGFPHFLEGGRTAVRLAEPNGGYLLNPIREFVTPGVPVPKGSVLFKISPGGAWMPLRKY